MYFQRYIRDAVGGDVWSERSTVFKVSMIRDGKGNRRVVSGGEEWACCSQKAFEGRNTKLEETGWVMITIILY